MEKILNDIKACLNKGYTIAELNDVDKAEVRGYVWGVSMVENAFDNIDAELMSDDTIISKIKSEYLAEVWSEVYRALICDGACLIYSLLEKPEYMEVE